MREPRGATNTSLKLRFSMDGVAEVATLYAFNGCNFALTP